jgi:hypothetical protein
VKQGGMIAFVGIDNSSRFLMKDSVFNNITISGLVGGVMSVQGLFGGVGMIYLC